MSSSHNIWIPSKQQYVGFHPFTTSHQLNLARAIELDQTGTNLDFEQEFAGMVTDLSRGEIEGTAINVYDKLAIGLQLAVMYVGDNNETRYICEHCSRIKGEPVSTSIKYTISGILEKLHTTIDCNPSRLVMCENNKISAKLDILPAANTIQLLRFKAHQYDIMNVSLFNWVESLNIGDQIVRPQHLNYHQQVELFNHIPLAILFKIKEYVESSQTTDTTLLSLKCAHCSEGVVNHITFSIHGINSLIEGALGLNLESIYRSIYLLSTIGIPDIYNTTPIERGVYKKFSDESKQQG